jgi:16S rRNA (cytosine967-C5)-methyltransferase
VPSPSAPAAHALPLAVLLGHTADAVQAVRSGMSLNEALARTPLAARPGTQALAFAVLRRLGSAQWARARLAARTPPPGVDALLLTALALLWPAPDQPYAEYTLVDQAVAAMRARSPGGVAFANAILRRFARERDQFVADAQGDPVARTNHPRWWLDRLAADWPAEAPAILAADNLRPPMTLRVNARSTTAQEYVERLARADIAARVVEWAAPPPLAGPNGEIANPAAIPFPTQAAQLDTPRPVHELPGFASGDVSVQDANAQLAAPLLAAGLPPGARVLDACAAPGGKTGHLLELGDFDVLAIDRDRLRLAKVDQTLARLGLKGQTLAADAADPAAWWDGKPFDAILLDAPCSASGIVRRHPDVRWLRRAADIEALAHTQRQLLEALWPTLAAGGRLLYCTCSVFKAEGGAQIDAFLQREPAAALTARPASPGHLLPLGDNPDMVVAPGFSSAPDGFFHALIEKRRA